MVKCDALFLGLSSDVYIFVSQVALECLASAIETSFYRPEAMYLCDSLHPFLQDRAMLPLGPSEPCAVAVLQAGFQLRKA